MASELAELNGSLTRYDYRSGTGPCRVLVHEMGGTVESWDAVVAALPADMAVLRYDTRGAGQSEKLLQACCVDTLAEDLLALLDHLDITEPVVLAGVAVGAGIAIRFTACWPHRVAHLLAMAPACGVAAAAVEAGLQKAAAIAEKGMRSEGMPVFERAYPEALRTDRDAYVRNYARWLGADARSLGAIFAMLVRMDVSVDLSAIQVPTSLIGGDFDPLRPPVEIARLAALAPQAEALQVASGHFMAAQSPRWVAHLLHNIIRYRASARSLHEDFIRTPGHVAGAARHLT